MYRKPKKIKKKKLIIQTKLFWILVFCAFVFCGAFYGVVFSSFVQIQNIQVKENDATLHDGILQLVGQSIQKNIAGFRMQSILFLNAKSIETAILKQFPEIASVRVERTFPHALLVVPKNRKETALWCPAYRQAGKTQDSCFAIDAHGIVFREQKTANDFVLWNFAENSDPQLGKAIISEQALSPILTFKEKGGVALVSASIISDIQIQFKTSEGWQIFIDPTGNLDWQITKLQTVLEQKIPSDKRKTLDYIDLRYGDQAYLKYQGM